MAVTVGQLTSCEPSHILFPATKLISDRNTGYIMKCDLLNRSFEKVETPKFDFSNHTTVQIARRVYATSYYDMKVTRVDHLLSAGQEIELTYLNMLNETRNFHTACAFRDKALFFIGGRSGVLGGPISSVHRFDLMTLQFSEEPELNQARTAAASCILNGKLYAIGGWCSGQLDSIEQLDVASQAKAWQIIVIPSMS